MRASTRCLAWRFAMWAAIGGVLTIPSACRSGFDHPGQSPVTADGSVCASRCLDNTFLESCTQPTPIECALGCNMATNACSALVPSNDARFDEFTESLGPLHIPDFALAELDTDSGALLIDGITERPSGLGVSNGIGYSVTGEGAAVIAASEVSIGIGADLVVLGSRPLIILSESDVEVLGIIDVSAAGDGDPRTGGPGGGDGAELMTDEATGCAPGGAGSGAGGVEPETGGGGGGFGEDGAAGGDGGAGGSLAGAMCTGTDLVPLSGGSGGGAGGDNNLAGRGGGGGGAIQITSLTLILFDGTDIPYAGIDACGGGGGGGVNNTAGGGGGSGGGILLEAPEVALYAAAIVANGGGGGGGGLDGDQGESGEDGWFGDQAAEGGDGQHEGGDGGARGNPPTPGNVGNGDNTGGGGGGVGIVRIAVQPGALDMEMDVIMSPQHTETRLTLE